MNLICFFANGGDQNNDSIPEKDICEEYLGIGLIDGLVNKIQSSSCLLMK